MHIEPAPSAIALRELGEIAVAEHASRRSHGWSGHIAKRGLPRDHKADMFVGYEFCNLNNELDRGVYCAEERKIIINTGAPTVQLYVDSRGHFRDAARLLLVHNYSIFIAEWRWVMKR